MTTILSNRRAVIVAIVLAFVVALLAPTLFAVPGAQAAITVSVDITNIVVGLEGSLQEAHPDVSVGDVGGKVGQPCDVTLTGMNPGSAHPNNDFILGTNGETLTAADFEEFQGKVTAVSARMVMGPVVTFDVRMGEDEISSGGLTATFDCGPKNEVSDWCEEGVKFDNLSGLTFTVPEPPDGTTWTLLVLKAGLDHQEIVNPVVGQEYSHENGKNISHAILCYIEGTTTTTTTTPDGTTTTTTPDGTTTTTAPDGTTTTTTLDGTTTTTAPDGTTTTSIPKRIKAGTAYIDEGGGISGNEERGLRVLILAAALISGLAIWRWRESRAS